MGDLVKVSIEGSTYSIEKGTLLSHFLIDQKWTKKPVLADVDGQVSDLDTPLEKDSDIRFLYEGSAEVLEILRHSASHLLAHAVLDLFPGTQTGIGPAVENGFYYDFLREKPFTIEDLSAIETRMYELAQKDIPIERVILSKKEAIDLFKEKGQDLKVELIQEKAEDEVVCYKQEDFIDFCLGPHVPSTGSIKHFKLMSVSGAYWKGDESGRQLQRIYGTVFFTRKELRKYLDLLEEAKKRDHRKLGPGLDLFSFNEDLGGGLILWHPKGAVIRKEIENYWYEEHFKDDYEIVYTPHIAKLDVWRRSGHTEYYDAMYPPIQSEGIEYELKPMNCPFAMMIFKSRQHSYRDLPLRWAELGTVYRHERSGVLHGLLRVRGFTVDDAHIFCRRDQLKDEITRVISLAMRMFKTFGFKDYEIFLSTCPEKYCGALEDWGEATKALEEALKDQGLDFKIDEGEGVFYGPKIDIKVKDTLQRSWQCSTIQLDFNLAERFDLNYIGEDGKFHRPFLVHRALLGSLERFFGILIEQYNGNFPLWLAPVQVGIIPIADRHNEYAQKLNKKFKDYLIRSFVDTRREKMGHKIRDAENNKIPLILVVGDKEMNQNTASLRVHTQGDKGEIQINEFLEKVKEFIKNKSLSVDF
jgi:threonyl-tRNA synthetase